MLIYSECITENPARTVKRVKEILHKRNCRIAPVAYLFDKKGVILVSIGPRASYDDLYEVVLEGGAEDVRETEDENGTLYEVYLVFTWQYGADTTDHHACD